MPVIAFFTGFCISSSIKVVFKGNPLGNLGSVSALARSNGKTTSKKLCQENCTFLSRVFKNRTWSNRRYIDWPVRQTEYLLNFWCGYNLKGTFFYCWCGKISNLMGWHILLNRRFEFYPKLDLSHMFDNQNNFFFKFLLLAIKLIILKHWEYVDNIMDCLRKYLIRSII